MFFKKLIFFLAILYFINCVETCISKTPVEPEDCEGLTLLDQTNYCCYFEGKNEQTGVFYKKCWEFKKENIDNERIQNTIEQLEKGTDDHVDKKHSGVKLDCNANYLKIFSLITFALLL